MKILTIIALLAGGLLLTACNDRGANAPTPPTITETVQVTPPVRTITVTHTLHPIIPSGYATIYSEDPASPGDADACSSDCGWDD